MLDFIDLINEDFEVEIEELDNVPTNSIIQFCNRPSDHTYSNTLTLEQAQILQRNANKIAQKLQNYYA